MSNVMGIQAVSKGCIEGVDSAVLFSLGMRLLEPLLRRQGLGITDEVNMHQGAMRRNTKSMNDILTCIPPHTTILFTQCTSMMSIFTVPDIPLLQSE